MVTPTYFYNNVYNVSHIKHYEPKVSLSVTGLKYTTNKCLRGFCITNGMIRKYSDYSLEKLYKVLCKWITDEILGFFVLYRFQLFFDFYSY